jgi:hypothetical protein
MDNSEVKKTTVNVKDVEAEAWEMCRKLAAKHDENLGAIVSRALRQLYQIDSGPRELSPTVASNLIQKSANPMLTPEMPSPYIVQLLNAGAAIAASNDRKLRSVAGLSSLLAEKVRAERGLPPLASRSKLPRHKQLAYDDGGETGE